MSLAVIIPVKSSGAKSRLSGVLSSSQREEFGMILLDRVLSSVKKAGLIRSTYVVSSDSKALKSATSLGVGTVTETSDAGVNTAVLRGLRAAQAKDVLVIPSDLPLLTPANLRHLLSFRGTGLDVVVAPSRAFDGTNALLFPSESRLPLSYDDNSFWNHLAGAAKEHLSTGVCTEKGLMFDVDSPDDLRSLANSRRANLAVTFAKKALP